MRNRLSQFISLKIISASLLSHVEGNMKMVFNLSKTF